MWNSKKDTNLCKYINNLFLSWANSKENGIIKEKKSLKRLIIDMFNFQKIAHILKLKQDFNHL